MRISTGITIILFGIIVALPVVYSSYAQTGSNASPIEGVIMIKEAQNKTVYFQPDTVTVKVGGEVLIANVAKSGHSVTSGSGPDDPMAGKKFNTDVIKPGAFVEYVPENLKPGNYSFYSSTDPHVKGKFIIVPPS
jgi:plastocyanin